MPSTYRDGGRAVAPATDSGARSFPTGTRLVETARDVIDKLVVSPSKAVVQSPAVHKTVITSLVLSTIVAVSLAVSGVAYWVFYWNYIPRIGTSKAVWLQYGHGRPPFAEIDLSSVSFASEQIYDVVLDLVVPSSRSNMDLGNFMVDLELHGSKGGAAVIKSARSASLIWRPSLVDTIQTILRLPLYLLFGSGSPQQKLRVPLVTRQVLRRFRTGDIAKAVVSVGRADAYPASAAAAIANGENSLAAQCQPYVGAANVARELQVYKADLRFVAHLQGFRWFMYNHRIISFLFFSSTFFVLTLGGCLTIWAITALLSRASSGKGLDSAVAKDNGKPRATQDGASGKPRSLTDLQRHDLAERQAGQERAREAARQAGPRMQPYGATDADDTVLGHVKLEDEESKSGLSGAETSGDESAVVVKGEESGDEAAKGWEDVPAKKEDLDDDAETVGGSAATASLAGEQASTRSFGTSVTSVSTATSASDPSLRRRPSSRSVRSVKYED